MDLDLLSWPELRDAEADLASAHARQVEAARRYRYAPHGTKSARLSALKEALQASLRAEVHLAQARGRARAGG